MPRLIDLTGEQFGRWTVLQRDPDRPKNWLCRCKCGREKSCYSPDLRTGKSQSCGCLRGEMVGQRNKDSAKHGMFGTPEYKAWHSMIDRCENPNNASYARYGGRGVRVCPEWRASFEAFYAELGERPSPEHSLGRIDNDQGYEPGNCRWETPTEQANNRSNSIWLEHKGERRTLAEWARSTGLRPDTLKQRIFELGWDMERALTAPPTRDTRKKAA